MKNTHEFQPPENIKEFEYANKILCQGAFGVVALYKNKYNDYMAIKVQNNKIYLVDFGSATQYLDDEGGHIAKKEQRQSRGSHEFASIYTQQGIEAARIDDYISAAYSILLLRYGYLPWYKKEVANFTYLDFQDEPQHEQLEEYLDFYLKRETFNLLNISQIKNTQDTIKQKQLQLNGKTVQILKQKENYLKPELDICKITIQKDNSAISSKKLEQNLNNNDELSNKGSNHISRQLNDNAKQISSGQYQNYDENKSELFIQTIPTKQNDAYHNLQISTSQISQKEKNYLPSSNSQENISEFSTSNDVKNSKDTKRGRQDEIIARALQEQINEQYFAEQKKMAQMNIIRQDPQYLRQSSLNSMRSSEKNNEYYKNQLEYSNQSQTNLYHMNNEQNKQRPHSYLRTQNPVNNNNVLKASSKREFFNYDDKTSNTNSQSQKINNNQHMKQQPVNSRPPPSGQAQQSKIISSSLSSSNQPRTFLSNQQIHYYK
ncbi:protein kinase domain containing protein [Stylonychia lemnae]|uniref:Protein kinase domain containing protein n=1 Tax=Stylonychia lemnae TaxID=5949 RepID=A0A078AZY6_STYLE|nr:protein kinase domain containing protein [Stylonychia lemnae]|eukprot:CDW87809.1 protein kinase domain containing protein [Stylonychia lemnae]